MKIALTVWGNRISPVLESAKTLMIIKTEGEVVVNREYQSITPQKLHQLIDRLHQDNVDNLICGAITDLQSIYIRQNGIRLSSFITGDTEKVIASYLKKSDDISKFRMPGNIQP